MVLVICMIIPFLQILMIFSMTKTWTELIKLVYTRTRIDNASSHSFLYVIKSQLYSAFVNCVNDF